MKKGLIWVAALTLLLVVGLAPKISAQPPANSSLSIFDSVLIEPEEQTPNISTQQMKALVNKPGEKIFDTRPEFEYMMGHIPGVIHLGPKLGSTREAYTGDFHVVSDIVNNVKSASITLYCDGPFCGKSKRVAHDLVEAGFTNVRRYQLGIPVWRVLGGLTEIELPAVKHVLANDRTAVVVDTRSPAAFNRSTLPQAINIPATEVTDGKGSQVIKDAKEDGRLPMDDHNTRVIIVGDSPDDVKQVAKALAENAFSNVLSYMGTFAEVASANAVN